MAQKKKDLPKMFVISRHDEHINMWDVIFGSRGLPISNVLPPKVEFDISPGVDAEIILVDMEDRNYKFHDSILEIVLGTFPEKKVVAFSIDYVAEIADKALNSKASGYVFRRCNDFIVLDTLKKILAGERCFLTLADGSNTQKNG